MSAEPDRRRATYADLLALPDHVVGEIVNGELYASPRPTPKHASASSGLGADLHVRFSRRTDDPGRPGGWLILDETELHLGHQILVPDIGGWRRERMPALPETAWFEVAPDWVCEVLSPSTRRLDRATKLPVYACHGVHHAWLVDPDARQLEVFRNEDGRWVLVSAHFDDDVIRAEPFDAVDIELCHLWLQ